MDIKAQDLRIGNWVLLNDKPIKIQSVAGRGIDLSCGDGGMYDEYNFRFPCGNTLHGIDLSPEVLEKCGFKIAKEFSDNDYSYYLHKAAYLYLGIDWRRREKGFCPSILPPDGELEVIGINQIYLHQLQNLYFALMGEELTYNS